VLEYTAIMNPGRALRLHQLQDNIDRAQKLVKETEDALLVEDIPRRRARLEMDIKQLRTMVDGYLEEYSSLAAESPADTEVISLGRSLDLLSGRIATLSSRIDALSDQHAVFSAHLIQQMSVLHNETIIAMLSRPDPKERQLVATALKALADRPLQFATSSDILDSVLLALAEAQQQGGGQERAVVAEVSRVVEDPKLEVANKLKLSIPLIPFLLSYETELNLKTAGNLRAAWKKLLRSLGVNDA